MLYYVLTIVGSHGGYARVRCWLAAFWKKTPFLYKYKYKYCCFVFFSAIDLISATIYYIEHKSAPKNRPRQRKTRTFLGA